jgi:pyruvate-formate lyase-activating enzyme
VGSHTMDTKDTKLTPRSVKSFREAQAVSSRRLGFSVTQACPPRCQHCSVAASPELARTTFTKEFAKSVVGQMSNLRDVGIDFIDFTGGEPTLATDFVLSVSQAARVCGITSGIVTAAHWAVDLNSANKLIKKFSDIDHWDISTDVYHLPFVNLEKVEIAYKALTDAGKNALIRIAHHDPLTYEDAAIIDKVYRIAGRRIAFQPIGPVGRAADLFEYIPTVGHWDSTPCPSTGPLVQPGGHVAPCCAPLSHENYDHPLRLGNAFQEPLTELVTRWRLHPLLQTIRVWGFDPIIQWLVDADRSYTGILRHRTCHLCVELIRNRELCQIVMERASELVHRIKLAFALKHTFGEDWMDNELMRQAQLLLLET